MLTQGAHFITSPQFAVLSVSHLNSRSSMYICAPLLSLPLVLFKKRNLLSLLPIFFFLSPFYFAASSALFDINLLIIWSLGQLCIFPRLCCFHPWRCSKKKASVIVAHFLYILPFFSLLLHRSWLTSTSGLVCFTLLFLFQACSYHLFTRSG